RALPFEYSQDIEIGFSLERSDDPDSVFDAATDEVVGKNACVEFTAWLEMEMQEWRRSLRPERNPIIDPGDPVILYRGLDRNERFSICVVARVVELAREPAPILVALLRG